MIDHGIDFTSIDKVIDRHILATGWLGLIGFVIIVFALLSALNWCIAH